MVHLVYHMYSIFIYILYIVYYCIFLIYIHFVFQINLRLILVSGKTKEFLFSPSDSAGDIAQYVFDNWPHEWAEEGVSKAEILRLIYQGRFLHGNVTLGALGLPTGKTCVMHLVPRENLPEPNSQGMPTTVVLIQIVKVPYDVYLYLSRNIHSYLWDEPKCSRLDRIIIINYSRY